MRPSARVIQVFPPIEDGKFPVEIADEDGGTERCVLSDSTTVGDMVEMIGQNWVRVRP